MQDLLPFRYLLYNFGEGEDTNIAGEKHDKYIFVDFLLSDVARNNRATFFFEVCKREAVHQRSQVPVRGLPAECLTLPVVCNFLLRYFPLYAPDLEGMPRIPVSFFVSFFELLNYVAIIESARPTK